MKRLLLCMATLALLLSGIGQAGATTFDTNTSWTGGSIWAWGAASWNSAAIGETFIAPTDNVLQDFTFTLQQASNGWGPNPVTFEAQVFAWSGSLLAGQGTVQSATGAALFTSSPTTFSDDGSFQKVTVNTGGISLTDGSAYVALLTLQMADDWGVNDGNYTLYSLETTGHGGNDGGGGFVFDSPADGTGGDLTNPWTSGGGCYQCDYGDTAWKADFTPGTPAPPAPTVTPEPSSLILLGTGLLGLGGLLRRKLYM